MKKYIRDIIYGASDGLVTTFAIVAGVVGASLSPPIILIVGFAKLFADGFSMAAANYLGTKSEHEFFLEKNRGKAEKPELHQPFQSAVFTFFSFILLGSLPLFPYLLIRQSPHTFIYAAVITGVVLFLVGTARSLATGKKWFFSGLEMFLIGGVASTIAYIIGYLLKGTAN